MINEGRVDDHPAFGISCRTLRTPGLCAAHKPMDKKEIKCSFCGRDKQDTNVLIAGITGIIVFGVEFFGEPEFQTQNPAKFLAFNLPYVLIPLLLLVRMRKPLPFTRTF